MRFLNVSAERNLPEMITVQWELDMVPTGLLFVERSGSPEGPFETLNQIPISGNAYIDRNVNFDNIERLYFYRISIKKPVSLETELVSEVVTHEPLTAASYVGRMMLLEKKTALERINGKLCLLYIRKTHAKRCPKCWDSARMKAITENCDDCYGTGFEGGGFYAPIKIYVQFEPRAVSPSVDVTGKSDNMTTSGWTIGYPPLSHGDMIVRANRTDLRYRVENIAFTEEFDVRIQQQMSLVRHHASSKLMKMPIPQNVPSIDDVNIFKRNA